MGNFLGFTFSSSNDGTPVPSIKEKRGCTDVPMLLLFIASWAAIWVIFGTALKRGDPDRLIRGVDYADRICGKSDGVEDAPLALWPAIPGDVSISNNPSTLFSIKLCVDTCNKTQDPSYVSKPYISKKFLYYCIPTRFLNNTGSIDSQFGNSFNTGAEQAARAFGDLKSAWLLVLVSGVVAIVLSFVYAWFCKHFAGLLVWLSVLLIAVGGFFMSFTLLTKANEINDGAAQLNGNRVKTLRIMGYIAAAMTAIFLVLIIALRKRIKIAVQVVKESSKAVGDVPSLVLFPLVPLALALLYFVFWIYVAIFVLSVSVLTEAPIPPALRTQVTAVSLPENYKDRDFDQSMQRSIIFHFFHLLWNVQFLIYFSYIIVAGVIADWYFTPFTNGSKKRGSGENELRNGVVRRSMRRTVFSHLGTVAFGSLIIAIIQFIRAIITYLQQKSKDQNNRLQKALFACVQCCLKCVQCCMDKVSKNAFIFCSIYGDAFCPSAAASFGLVWRNLARVAAVSTVGSFIIVLGKLVVSFLTAGIAAFVMVKTSYGGDLSSPLLPGVVILLLAYIVSSLFMIIYETAIDTIFLCFLIDEENNKGGNMLASPELQKIIDEHAAASKEIADRAGGGGGDNATNL